MAVENNSSAQEQLDSELDKLAKKELAATIYSDYDEQFQAVGIIALLLIILEACLLEVRNPLLRNVSLFKRETPPHLILLLVMMVMSYLSPLAVSAQTDRQLVRQGNKHFRAGNYADAEVAYRKAIEKNPRNPQANFNLGNSLFAQRKDSSAVAQFDTASKLDSSPLRRAQAYHNMGVVCQGKKRFGEAIEAYKEALRLNPADDESRYNLALCKRQQKEQQEQQQQEQQQQQQKQDQQKKDEQQQQQQEQQEKKEQQQKEQQEKPQMSRENAEQMLNAAIQDEKRTQESMKKAQQKSQKRRLEKNW